jgi:hypothetical protein
MKLRKLARTALLLFCSLAIGGQKVGAEQAMIPTSPHTTALEQPATTAERSITADSVQLPSVSEGPERVAKQSNMVNGDLLMGNPVPAALPSQGRATSLQQYQRTPVSSSNVPVGAEIIGGVPVLLDPPSLLPSPPPSAPDHEFVSRWFHTKMQCAVPCTWQTMQSLD